MAKNGRDHDGFMLRHAASASASRERELLRRFGVFLTEYALERGVATPALEDLIDEFLEGPDEKD